VAARKYSDGQRRVFLATVDRGGTVRGAAVAAGVSPNTGYRWMRQAGLVTSRSTPRLYSDDDKAMFFRRLAEVGNVSAVAGELGFNRVTCYSWAHRAGVFTSKYADGRRQEFLQLRAEGVSRRAAARTLGVEAHQASDWDRGIRSFAKGRVYPDGRVVLYRQDEILAAVRNPRTGWAQGEKVPLAKVEQIIDRRYLSLVERERVKDLVSAGVSIRKIAGAMGRAPSTISRELRRNTIGRAGYLPHTAHRLSVKRRQRPKTAKLARPGPLRDYVATKLAKRWSPEQICHRLRKDHPGASEMRVCTETVYQAIYVHAKGELKQELAGSLRRGRARRKPHRRADERSSRFVDSMTPVSERPAEADDRAVPGHWEGDCATRGRTG
jgi:IS30 family transposase